MFLKVPPSFVSKMVNGDKPIPLEHMAPIEEFTGKQVTRQEMLPDGWQTMWPELTQVQAAIAQPAIKKVAEEQCNPKEPIWNGTERRQPDAPWDGNTERRKLNAPVERRVSPASVAQAEFLRGQSVAKDQNATGAGA